MKKFLVIVGGGLVLSLLSPISTLAVTLTSPSYQFQETSLGGSGLIGSQSSNYQTEQAVGIIGVGNSASANFQTYDGNITTGAPALGFGIINGTGSFGSFSPSTAAVATTTFQVVDYTSFGYIVQIYGNPPALGAHTISRITSPSLSQVDTEQFGINVVANVSPTSVGANPDNGSFGYGAAAHNSGSDYYDTANYYMYNSGDTIANAPKSSGNTIYTISYLVNVNSLTPAGAYSSSQTIICIPTF